MDIQSFVDKLFARAEQAGFEAYEAYCASGENFDVSVFGGEIDEYSVSGSLGLSFRGLKDGRMGYASTQVLDEEAVEMLVEGALTNAQLIESEDAQFIFEGSKAYPQLPGANPALARVTAQQKIEKAKALEQCALSLDERVKQVQGCELFASSGSVRIVNSKGLDVTYEDNCTGFYVAVVARQDDQVNTGSKFHFTRNFEELNPRETAAVAVREAVAGLDARPVASGSYHVVLRGDVAGAILSTFASVFSAESAQKGLSLLKGREGQQIASDVVTLVDDPHHATALSVSPFDAEGVATYRKEIIARGVLTTLMHNLKTAAKQGVQTTANAAKGSYAAAVDVAPSNFFFAPSEESMEQLIQRAGEGLMITEVQGLHAGANQVSGDFSLGAKGVVIRNGQLGEAVQQITVAGNFFDLLRQIEAVGSDLQFGFPGVSCVGSPSILVSGLSVAGL